jgi:hypothetical protein
MRHRRGAHPNVILRRCACDAASPVPAGQYKRVRAAPGEVAEVVDVRRRDTLRCGAWG